MSAQEQSLSAPQDAQWPPLRAETAVMRRRGHWRRRRWWLTMLLALVLVAAGILGTVGMHSVMSSMGADRIATAISMIAVGLITFGCIARAWIGYWRWDMDELCRATPPDAPQLAFYRAQRVQIGGSLFMRSKTRGQWLTLARSTGVITWVDQRIAEEVFHLPRINRPIEPERVGTFWQQADTRFAAVAAMIGGMQLLGRNKVAGVTWLIVAGISATRLLRRGALFEPVVAGQGWVQHGRARWTVDDSVAILKRRSRNGLHISVIGPAGSLRLQVSLRGPKDDSLREFWQRWCHPAPRIDQPAFDA